MVCVYSCVSIFVSIAHADDKNSFPKLYESITRASYDGVLSFSQPGRVLEIKVKPGDIVKEGDLLVRYDDRVEQAQKRILALEANNDIRLKAAIAQKELKKTQFERVDSLYKQNISSKKEYEEALIEVQLAEMSIDITKLDIEKAKIQYEQIEAQIALKHIVAAVDGVIEDVYVDVGESVEQAQPIIRLINDGDILIDVLVPIGFSDELKVDQKCSVYLSPDDSSAVLEGKIVFISPIADVALEAVLTRVSIDKYADHLVGLKVWVEF